MPSLPFVRDRSVRALLAVFVFVVLAFGFITYRTGNNAARIEQIQHQNCTTTNANDVAFNHLLDQLAFNLKHSMTQTQAQIQRGLENYAAARRTLENC